MHSEAIIAEMTQATKNTIVRAPVAVSKAAKNLESFVPEELRNFENAQTAIPALAKDARLLAEIERAVQRVPTQHVLHHQDARRES